MLNHPVASQKTQLFPALQTGTHREKLGLLRTSTCFSSSKGTVLRQTREEIHEEIEVEVPKI